jgi:hypothetical protein
MGARYEWERFAAGTTPRLPDATRTSNRIKIPWPQRPERSKYEGVSFIYLLLVYASHDAEPHVEATMYTAKAEDVMAITYKPSALPPDESVSVSKVDSENHYVQSVLNPQERAYDVTAPMELHLQKELSNPHSRAKKQARWQAALARRRELLAQYVRNELKDLKGRTRREARAEAVWKWRERLRVDAREEKKMRWIHRGDEAALLRRRARKARKERKREERLRDLALEEAPNQVIPVHVQN